MLRHNEMKNKRNTVRGKSLAAGESIDFKGVRTLNLKSIDISFRVGELNAITGVSGSGKTALAVHTLVSASKQFLLPLRPAARKRETWIPAVFDSFEGLTPALSLNEFAARLNTRENVGTVLNLWTSFAELLAATGRIRCARKDCAMAVCDGNSVRGELAELALTKGSAEARVLFGAVFRQSDFADLGHPAPKNSHKKDALWFVELIRRCMALNYRRFLIGARAVRLEANAEIDFKQLTSGQVPEEIAVVVDSMPLAGVATAEGKIRFGEIQAQVFSLGSRVCRVVVLPGTENPFHSGTLEKSWPRFYLATGSYCSVCGQSAPQLTSDFVLARIARAEGRAAQRQSEFSLLDVFIGNDSGARLIDQPISAVTKLLSSATAGRSGELLRLDKILSNLGISHLPGNRKLADLSDGERLALACAFLELVSMTETLIVIDQPSRILHPQNLEFVYDWCRRTLTAGNTLVVVESDPSFLSRADFIVELGPGAGAEGGRIMYQGEPPRAKPVRRRSRSLPPRKQIVLERISRGGLYAIVGVCGSGKSRLLAQLACSKGELATSSKKVPAQNEFRSVRLLPASSGRAKPTQEEKTVAELAEVFLPLAELYAALPDARRAGYERNDFMLMTNKLRCDACEGSGREMVEAGVSGANDLACASCNGRRYNTAAQEVRFNEVSLPDTLSAAAGEMLRVFSLRNELVPKLQMLSRFGLLHLRLGARMGQISAADRQRLLLAAQLLSAPEKTLFLLDQAFAGLSASEIELCMLPLRQATQRGAAFVFSTHAAEVISKSDYIIELDISGRVSCFGKVASPIPD